MTHEELIDLLDAALAELVPKPRLGAGVESVQPPLRVLRFYARPVRLNPIPWLGRGLSIVAVADPGSGTRSGHAFGGVLLEQVARIASVRYPPTQGPSLALTTVAITSQSITPDSDSVLASWLVDMPRFRTVALGIFLVNLEQEAIAIALRRGPANLYPEPELVADTLTARLRRFVPPVM